MSAQMYSSGSDECSSGAGGSVAGFDGVCGVFDGDDDWCNSEARCQPPMDVSGEDMDPLGLLFASDKSTEMREKVVAILGESVQNLSICSEFACGSMEAESGIGGPVMVMGEEKSSVRGRRSDVSAKFGEESEVEVEMQRQGAAMGNEEEISRVEDTYVIGGSVDRVNNKCGSGLKLLIEAHNYNSVDQPINKSNNNDGLISTSFINEAQNNRVGLFNSKVDPTNLGC